MDNPQGRSEATATQITPSTNGHLPFAVEGEALLAAIVESSDDAIISKDLHGIIRSWNRGAERIFGYTAEEMIGRSITLLAVPERVDEIPNILARIRKGERLDHYETKRQTKDGRVLSISLTVSPVRNAAGQIVGASKIARDITERKRLEEALEERSRQLAARERYQQAVLESMPECIKVLGPNGELLEMNKAGLQMVEADHAEQVIGSCVYPLVDEGYRDKFRSVNESVFHGGNGGALEFAITGLKGTHRTFETRVVPLRDENNTVIGALSATRDITEERKFFEAQQEARQTAELLNRVGPVLAAELDTQALMQKVTDLATQLTGAQFGALFHNLLNEQGESYTLYTLSGVEREAFAQFPMPRNTHVFGPTFRNEGVVRSDDITKDPRYGQNAPHHGMPEGHLPVRSYLAVSVVARSGEVLGGLFFGHSEPGRFTEQHEQLALGIAAQAAIALDNARLFTQSQRAQEALARSNAELRRANEDLEQFAYSASHDLQEPLRMVSLYSQMVQRKYRDKLDQEAQEYLGYAVQGALRMEMLVRDLLAYTQAVSVKSEAVTPVSATDVLSMTVDNLRGTIQETGAQIEREPLPYLLVQEVHLLQLFQNLLSNALKYHGEAAALIQVWATPEQGMWRLCVRDNGIGIDSEYAEQVFGIFKRLHNDSRYQGTGIGLAICQKIVERYGGRIWVESEGPGRGSTFCFTLPGAESSAK